MHPSKLIIVLVALAVVAVSAKEDSTFKPGMAPSPPGPQAPTPAPGKVGTRFFKPDAKAKGTEDDKTGKSAANAGKTDDQDDKKDTTETDQLMAMVRRAVLYSQKDTKSKAGDKSKTDPSEGADGAQDGTNVQQKPPTKRSAKEPSKDKSGDETDANASTLTVTNTDEGSQTTANDQTAGAAKKDPSEGDDQSAKLKARKAMLKRDPEEPAQDPTKDAQDDTSKDKKDDKKSKGNSMQRRSKPKASTKGKTGAKGDEDQQMDQQKGQQEDPAAGADTQLTRRAAHKDVRSVKSNGKTKGEDPAQQDDGVPAPPANKRSFYRKRAQFRRMAPAGAADTEGDVDNTDDASANQDAKDTGNKDKTQGHDQTQDMGQTKGKM